MKGYLFRTKNSEDNASYFEIHRKFATEAYAGVSFRIGEENWTPDFVAVRVYEDNLITLILVSLEARTAEARISARKYLPEDPVNLLKGFDAFLGRIVKTCRATADPREKTFQSLRQLLRGSKNIDIYSAAVLKGGKEFIEKHPLIYQSDKAVGEVLKQKRDNEVPKVRALPLAKKSLNAKEVNWFFGTIAVLDAVIRGKDTSSATYKSWRTQIKSLPLKDYLRRRGHEYPALFEFAFLNKTSGAEIDVQAIVRELAQLWAEHLDRPVTVKQLTHLVKNYSSESLALQGHHGMQKVFTRAREVVSKHKILGD